MIEVDKVFAVGDSVKVRIIAVEDSIYGSIRRNGVTPDYFEDL